MKQKSLLSRILGILLLIELPLVMNNREDAVITCYDSARVNNETMIPILENGGVFMLTKHLSG